jgi:phosphate starvation-inducible PhoH-like protein
MRGRTLNDAFIILDEAQNSTVEQMKMFLTRLGFNSKMVITGDITQVDLPASRGSGLIEVQSILKSVPGIRFVYFDDQDVVRHPLVSAIIRAYDAHVTSPPRGATSGRAPASPVQPALGEASEGAVQAPSD